MKGIMALMVLVLLVGAAFAQSTDCTATRDDVRRLAARVEYLVTVNQAQATELGNRINTVNQQVKQTDDNLFKNQDMNSLQLKNDITSEMAFRTDPVRNVMPFILGFCFCFCLFSAIAIKFNFFMLRKMREVD